MDVYNITNPFRCKANFDRDLMYIDCSWIYLAQENLFQCKANFDRVLMYIDCSWIYIAQENLFQCRDLMDIDCSSRSHKRHKSNAIRVQC